MRIYALERSGLLWRKAHHAGCSAPANKISCFEFPPVPSHKLLMLGTLNLYHLVKLFKYVHINVDDSYIYFV